MKLFTPILALFALASTATAYARCPPCNCTTVTNDAPLAHYASWNCRLKAHLLWDTYTLKGTNWLAGEDEIRRTCRKAGLITKWNYEEEFTKDDKVKFVATVSTHTIILSSYTNV